MSTDALYDNNGAQYNVGKLIANINKDNKLSLNYNEYIVYNPSQVCIKYLLKVEK